jgi:hypothetical protein
MQTFLPFPDFKKSLLFLDNKRLGKQRVEAKTLLDGKWQNHPASKMWRGYETALAVYYNESLHVWEKKGGQNIKLKPVIIVEQTFEMPWWFGYREFHLAHLRALYAKWHGGHYAYLWPLDKPNFYKGVTKWVEK